jgi:3-deoxy-D-manno-octulosonic-acid transferase
MKLITLYNILLFIGMLAAFPVMLPIILLSEKRRKTVLQRLGFRFPHSQAGETTPASHKFVSLFCRGGELTKRCAAHSQTPAWERENLWIHALSVGEVLSAVPLVKALSGKACPLVFSASTLTGFEIANKLLRDHTDTIFYFPYDLIFSVKHIATKVKPAAVVMVETDIWPNFLFEMERRGVPVLLVNARLSKRSFEGYKRLSFFTQSLFSKFSKICAQSAEDARRFSLLAVPPNAVIITGNMKFDQAGEPVSGEEFRRLRESVKAGPKQKIILAGSTHSGEEQIIGDAFSRLKKADENLLLIAVPRDPKRAGSVCRIFTSLGFSAVAMSELKNSDPGKKNDVVVVDVMGLLRRLYALADIAYVGGSLTDFGGHNPLEPAVFSKPILFGPFMSDFKEISDMLLQADGAVQVRDAESFYEAATNFLNNGEKARYFGEQAFKIFYTNRGAVEKTLAVIADTQACL